MKINLVTMSNHLYHFFPKKFEGEENALSILKSIFEHGLFLSKEMRNVDWKDVHAIGGMQRQLNAEQLRLCLTAITNDAELEAHSKRFGLIGLEFNEEFIMQLGGFPVFYVPTPKDENASDEEHKGVSLLYRLADAQQILEYIVKNNVLETKDIDIENVLGAIKFLANIFYPTQRKLIAGATEINYYNQREWRVIYNLTSEKVKIGYYKNNYTIEEFNNQPIRNFITKVVVFEHDKIEKKKSEYIYVEIEKIVNGFRMNCKIDCITVK